MPTNRKMRGSAPAFRWKADVAIGDVTEIGPINAHVLAQSSLSGAGHAGTVSTITSQRLQLYVVRHSGFAQFHLGRTGTCDRDAASSASRSPAH